MAELMPLLVMPKIFVAPEITENIDRCLLRLVNTTANDSRHRQPIGRQRWFVAVQVYNDNTITLRYSDSRNFREGAI